MKNKTIEFGSNPMRFIGVSYTTCNYFSRNDGRPLLRVSALFFVVWIRMPWKHAAKKYQGTRCYGLSIIPHRFYYNFQWGV